MEVNGKIVFFNEAEAIATEENTQEKLENIVKTPHPRNLLRGSLVSPSLEVAIMNSKYVNAVPLYWQEQEFERSGCADRYLAVIYDYLHEKLYGYHVLQADETPVLVNKDSPHRCKKLHVGVPHWADVYRMPDCAL